jgi:phosphotransferase system enzyme I (PtsI)
MKIIKGKAVSKGVAFGHVHLLRPDAIITEEKSSDSIAQLKAFEKAKVQANNELTAIFEKTEKEIGPDEAAIIDVQRIMLEDPDLNDTIESNIKDESNTAAFAVSRAGDEFAKAFAAMDDAYMKARATDISDLTTRLVNILAGKRAEEVPLTKDSIIVADDITPSQTLQLDKSKIVAFVTRRGSENSHSAILARTLGIPSIVKADVDIDDDLQYTPIAVDADAGRVYLNPTAELLRLLDERMLANQREKQELESVRGLESVTKSGKKMKIYANIGGPEDIDKVIHSDAEGVGLFRSEFLYLGRLDYPSEEEQFASYKEVVESLAPREVIIRTMDIGADKKVEYFDLEEEENPALGLRAIRICFDRPEMFKTQLRAIYRAAAHGNVSIMFPMITSVWEIQKCKAICDEVVKDLEAEGVAFAVPKIGIMIETPAAALISDRLAKEVDFFSIGTNDLTQYTLAVDRQNEALEQYLDKHHPALLRLIEQIIENGHKEGTIVGICGELGADKELTETFINWGLDEVSVTPPSVLSIRKTIRELD